MTSLDNQLAGDQLSLSSEAGITGGLPCPAGIYGGSRV